MLDFIDVNKTELKLYTEASKEAMLYSKNASDTDPFIITARKKAREKLKDAILPNGKIAWSKLPNLITSNTKLKKDVLGLTNDIEIFGLSLAPHYVSGYNTCNGLSIGCTNVCLMFTGHGQKFMVDCNGNHNVAIARIIRTFLWFEYREQFKARLLYELKLKYNLLKSKNIDLAFRPNVFSEQKFELLFKELFHFCNEYNIPMYDYVKDIKRIVNNPFKDFYHMTYSLSENNSLFIPTALKHGCNIAVVIDTPVKAPKPKQLTINGITLDVINGDKHDARFTDSKNKFVALSGKGLDVKNDTTNFIRRV